MAYCICFTVFPLPTCSTSSNRSSLSWFTPQQWINQCQTHFCSQNHWFTLKTHLRGIYNLHRLPESVLYTREQLSIDEEIRSSCIPKYLCVFDQANLFKLLCKTIKSIIYAILANIWNANLSSLKNYILFDS